MENKSLKEEIKKPKKEKPEKKGPGALARIFRTEYKFEGILLLIISIMAIVVGVLLLTPKGNPTLKVSEDVFLIGTYPKVFAGILIALGALCLVLAVWPYYKPSIGEIKRITWPTKTELLKDILATFTFSLILIVFFFLIDLAIVAIIKLL